MSTGNETQAVETTEQQQPPTTIGEEKSAPKKTAKKAVKKTTKAKQSTKKSAKKTSPKKAAKAKEAPAEENRTKEKSIKPKKAPAKKSAGKHFTPEETVRDRARSKAVGLPLIHYRVLRSLEDSKRPTEYLSYRQIEAKTGYYAMLAGVMHTDEKNSLCALDLARQGDNESESGRRAVTAFGITAAGSKLLAKALKADNKA